MDRDDFERESLVQWEKESLVGDRFADFVGSGWLSFLDEHIFDPLDKEAFELFKKAPADDMREVIESQMMSKMVDLIKGRIQSRIHQGENARAALINIGEEDGE